MTAAPDTFVLTGPNFQQISIGTALATPTGGQQTTVQSALGVFQASYFFTGTAAATDQVFFVATQPCLIKAIAQIHAVAAGGTSTLTVTKDTSTNAPGAGTSVMSGSFNLNATANTVQNATLAAAATITLAAGDRLAVKFANTIQATDGLVVTVTMVAAS